MTGFGMQLVWMPDGRPPPQEGLWLSEYDLEENDGRGFCVWARKDEAIRWETFGEAMLAWYRQSETHPLRDDGKPNRPLTAYTVRVMPL